MGVKINLELTRNEIEDIIQWAALVDSEKNLDEAGKQLVLKLEESLM